MKRACFVCLLSLLTTTLSLSQSNPISALTPNASVVSPASVSPISVSKADPKLQARILDGYGKMPLSFEANQGQTDGRVKFLSRTSGYSLFLTADAAVLTLRNKKAKNGKGTASAVPLSAEKTRASAPEGAADVLRMKLRHANPAAKVTGVDELAGTSNYFIGNDPTKWRTNVPTYAKVKYEGIYPGVDLVYYGNQRQLEYDFIVAPGADPRRIAFDIRGAKRIRRDAHGELVFKMGENEIRWHKPVVYQEKDGARQLIAARYAIADENRVGFELAKYDATKRLYIDPLIYSTYLGGSGNDAGGAIAVDAAGNAYVTGYTASTDFPTMNPLQPANGGGADAFVAKLNPAGSALVYSTYLGGSGAENVYLYLGFGDTAVGGIAVDSAGNAYVTGYTSSTDFPTMNPLQPANGGGTDAFVAKLNPTGSALLYSTYLGGSSDDYGFAITVDSAGNAYVAGRTFSADFPTKNPFQPPLGNDGDAFVSKLNPTGSALVYSTCLGDDAYGTGIAVDSVGDVYISGVTASIDFPVTPGAFQTSCGGPCYGNAFVSKFNPAGSALVYSTYLGGSEADYATAIALDGAGNVYVTGYTTSDDFPVTPGAFQTVCNGGQGCSRVGDAFVSKINAAGSALFYSTYLGGKNFDYGFGIAVDGTGDAYVTGYTAGSGFPLEHPLHESGLRGSGFVSKFNPAGSALLFSTYLGGKGLDYGFGIAVDGAGNAYVTGSTASTDFPTTPGAFQTTNGGGADAFAVEIDVRTPTTVTLSSAPNPSIYGQIVTFSADVTSSIGAPPNGESVSFLKGKTVLGTGALSGGSASFTTSTLPAITNSITAAYGGDSNFAGSTSNIVKQVVNKATTTTALTTSLNPSKVGQSVTFTASVTPEFSGTPTGNVSFYDGTTLLKTVTLSGGAAKYTTKALAHGAHTITATYNGSTSFSGSSASLMQTVN